MLFWPQWRLPACVKMHHWAAPSFTDDTHWRIGDVQSLLYLLKSKHHSAMSSSVQSQTVQLPWLLSDARSTIWIASKNIPEDCEYWKIRALTVESGLFGNRWSSLSDPVPSHLCCANHAFMAPGMSLLIVITTAGELLPFLGRLKLLSCQLSVLSILAAAFPSCKFLMHLRDGYQCTEDFRIHKLYTTSIGTRMIVLAVAHCYSKTLDDNILAGMNFENSISLNLMTSALC